MEAKSGWTSRSASKTRIYLMMFVSAWKSVNVSLSASAGDNRTSPIKRSLSMATNEQ